MPDPFTAELRRVVPSPRVLGPTVWFATFLALILHLSGVSAERIFVVVATVSLLLSAFRVAIHVLARTAERVAEESEPVVQVNFRSDD